MTHLEMLLVVGYFVVLGVLAVLGLHRLYLVALRLRADRPLAAAAAEIPSWPTVTVQLPLYNEAWVAGRLLNAVAALEYPRERLEVQVLDDSDDGSEQRVAETVRRLQRSGLRIVHLHRRDRTGYKAGALEAGLRRASGELICVFDADFVPPADFLRRIVPDFAEPSIGMVQARWGHLNRDFSLLTRLQAVLLDAHFAVEQAARSATGRFFNFNGTAGVWRRAAIEDAGGWQHDTLTEDLDLSYRAQLRGWRFLYLDSPQAPAELPVSIAALKSQQHRWTKGAVQTARKLLGQVWRSRQPLRVKVEASFHMLANLAYPAMVLLSLVAPAALYLRQRGDQLWVGEWVDAAILLSATGSVCVFFLVAQARVGASALAACVRLPALMALGVGMSLNNTVAVLSGLRRRPGCFVRTPKYAVTSASDRWQLRAVVPSGGGLLLLEVAFASWATAAVAHAVATGSWASLPLLLLFQAGYTYIAALSVAERRSVRAARPVADAA